MSGSGPAFDLDQMLAEARAGVARLTPAAALAAMRAGDLLVDIRPEAQRRRDGEIEGALVIDRNVLEWRIAPGSRWQVPELRDGARRVVVVCAQGYSSSLAAHNLRRLGVQATDVEGGFEAWLAAGLAVRRPAKIPSPGDRPEVGSG
jgi:rhodanese-related sulfurtransferase